MIHFSFSYIDYVLLAVLALATVCQGYFALRYMPAIIRHLRKQSKQSKQLEQRELMQPGVSIIVCAHNEDENLRQHLQALLIQDYPTYEVIVVDDQSQDETRRVVEEYARQCPYLYMTFVPVNTRVFSSKKLAITLGVKAAKYDYLILTDANARPEYNYWLRDMMQGFTSREGVDVVLGISQCFHRDKALCRWQEYEHLFSCMQYIGMAKAGHPYRGIGANIGYRRETFYAHHGFHTLLSYRSGDDDLFIRSIATKKNTAVVCSKESVVWKQAHTNVQNWLIQLRSHYFAAQHYPFGTHLRLSVEPVSRILLYIAVIVAFIIGTTPIRYAAASVLVARWLLHGLIMNRTAHRLGMKRVSVLWPIYDICLPFIPWLPVGKKHFYDSKTSII